MASISTSKKRKATAAPNKVPSKKTKLVQDPGTIAPPTRAGTPLSPFMEELFGDILDAEPETYPIAGLKDRDYWSDSEHEDEPKAKKPRVGSKESASLPAVRAGGLKYRIDSTEEAERVTKKVRLAKEPASSSPSQGNTSVDVETPPTSPAGPQDNLTAKKKSAEADSVPSIQSGSRSTKKVAKATSTKKPLFTKKATKVAPANSTPTNPTKSLPKEKLPPLDLIQVKFPIFCSSVQRKVSSGGSIGGLSARNTVGEFVSGIGKYQLARSTDKTIFEALSKARNIVEVRIDARVDIHKAGSSSKGKKRVTTKNVELARYFVPSPRAKGRFLEVHSNDVCGGLNPSGSRMGIFEGKVPHAVFACGHKGICAHSRAGSDLCHDFQRTITVFNNHLERATFAGRQPREVYGEWRVAGDSKEWGKSLAEAEVYWKHM